MTPAAPASPMPRSRSGRWQGALAIASLLACVLGTVLLVATPASSVPDGSRGSTGASTALPTGVRVEVRGGDPFIAYGVADRLSGAGASLGAVLPAASKEDVAPATTIVYYDRRSMAAAGRIRAMLGRGTLRRQQVFQPVVDVTIVLGKDLSRL